MLRATVSYAVSRVAAVAVIALALNLVVQPGCRGPASFGGFYGQIHTALDEINRALISARRL